MYQSEPDVEVGVEDGQKEEVCCKRVPQSNHVLKVATEVKSDGTPTGKCKGTCNTSMYAKGSDEHKAEGSVESICPKSNEDVCQGIFGAIPKMRKDERCDIGDSRSKANSQNNEA